MTTYTAIVTRVKQYTLDNEAPLVAVVDPLIDNIIGRAERRITRDLETDAMMVTSEHPMVAGGWSLDKPAGMIGLGGMGMRPLNGRMLTLALRTRSWIESVYSLTSLVGPPRWYCTLDEGFWRIAPSLDADYTAVLVWLRGLGGLSSGTPTTWLSDNCEELLFKAILAECEVFHRDGEAKQLYEADYAAELQRVAAEVARLRTDWSRA